MFSSIVIHKGCCLELVHSLYFKYLRFFKQRISVTVKMSFIYSSRSSNFSFMQKRFVCIILCQCPYVRLTCLIVNTVLAILLFTCAIWCFHVRCSSIQNPRNLIDTSSNSQPIRSNWVLFICIFMAVVSQCKFIGQKSIHIRDWKLASDSTKSINIFIK